MSNIGLLIAYATPDAQQEIAVVVPAGTTLQLALTLLATEIATTLKADEAVATGVWGKVRPPQYVLRDGDRIEIYRALKADPKQARRARVEPKIPRS